MEDLFWSARLGNRRRICISPLSRESVEQNELENLGNDFGYFIYEVDESSPYAGIEILAKAASPEAAMRLVDIYIIAQKRQRAKVAL